MLARKDVLTFRAMPPRFRQATGVCLAALGLFVASACDEQDQQTCCIDGHCGYNPVPNRECVPSHPLGDGGDAAPDAP
jgi:hypothetical protein